MWWTMFSNSDNFEKFMAESIEAERAAQEKRRKDEEAMWDPLGIGRKKIREAEDRFIEAEKRWREEKIKEEEKRKQMFPTPWEKDL